MKDSTMFWIAGGAVAAYFVFNTGTGATLVNSAAAIIAPGSPPVVPVIPGAAVAPAGWTNTSGYPYLVNGAPLPIPNPMQKPYYLAYIYPAMQAVNPNIMSSGYTLSNQEAQQYLTNYASIASWANDVVNIHPQPHMTDIMTAARYHWKTYGVVDQNTFMPLPFDFVNDYVVPPVVPKSSGGGGTLNTIASVAKIAAPFIAFLGVTPQDQLNDTEVELLITGGAILQNLLPLYMSSDGMLVTAIDKKLDSLISDYI